MIISDILNIDKKSTITIEVQCDNCNLQYSIKYNNYLRNGNKDGFYICKTCKTKKTNLQKYGVENPSQITQIKENKKKTLLKNWGVEHPSKSKQIKEKKKQTNLKNWGVENPFQSENIKSKIKKTNINRIGFENPSQSKEVKEKKKQSNLKNWGVEHPLQSNILLEKVKKTNLKNFGTEWVLNNESIKSKIKKTNIDKYGYDNPAKSPLVKKGVIENNKIKWGVEHFYQSNEFKEKAKITLLRKWNVESPIKSPYLKDKIEQTNLEKWGNKEYFNTDDFKVKSKNTLECKWESYSIQQSELFRHDRFKITKDKNYIKYIKNRLSLFKCDEGHEFEIKADNYYSRIRNKVPLCTICNPIGDLKSIKEKLLFEFIKSIYDGEIIQSYRDGLEIDIYLPELNIGFEFNGIYWHSELYKDRYYHVNKTNFFKNKGIKVIHIWEDEWDNKQDIVKSKIESIFGNNIVILAKNCEIRYVEESSYFLIKNHINGNDKSSVKIGLFYDDKLVSLMTFKKLNTDIWIISRFCNELYYDIVEAEKTLMLFFLEKYKPKSLFYHLELDKYFYRELGFKLVKETKPKYRIINNNKIWDCGKLILEINI